MDAMGYITISIPPSLHEPVGFSPNVKAWKTFAISQDT